MGRCHQFGGVHLRGPTVVPDAPLLAPLGEIVGENHLNIMKGEGIRLVNYWIPNWF